MNRVEFVFSKARAFYENGDPGHDIVHIHRVMENCRRIGASVGADLEMLLAAAILHDVVNLPKNHPDRLVASKMAAEKSRAILEEAGFSATEIARIGEIITEHSYSLGKKPSLIESAVLQDADKLDALGAIGVMRMVTCGAKMGASYYEPSEPFAEARALDDKTYSVDHFFTKLLKLPDLMNTEAARAEAKERADFMRAFLDQLRKEIS